MKSEWTVTVVDRGRDTLILRGRNRIPAQALRQLMRHASLQTTLTFYATDDCGLTDAIWGPFGDKSGDKAKTAKPRESRKAAKSR
jgi:hypothetical protein